MRVECEVVEEMLENDDGREVPGIVVTCGRCSHAVESFGQSERSVKRCLAMLREECQEHENNFYVSDQEENEE